MTFPFPSTFPQPWGQFQRLTSVAAEEARCSADGLSAHSQAARDSPEQHRTRIDIQAMRRRSTVPEMACLPVSPNELPAPSLFDERGSAVPLLSLAAYVYLARVQHPMWAFVTLGQIAVNGRTPSYFADVSVGTYTYSLWLGFVKNKMPQNFKAAGLNRLTGVAAFHGDDT